MRVPDRRWWVKLCAACSMIVAPVGGLVAFIVTGAFSNTLGNITSLFPPGILAGFAALYAVVAIIYVWLAVALVRDGLRGREHLRLRQRALQGGEDGLPRARVAAPSGAIPDLSAKSLELLWEARRGTRAVTGSLHIVVVVVQVAIGVISDLLFFVPAGMDVHAGKPLTIPDIVFALLGVLILMALGVLVVLFRRYAGVMFGRRFGVVASDTGLTELRQDGRQVTVPWAEVRLFEVDRRRLPITKQTVARTYRVYGTHSMVSWGGIQRGGTDFRPVGMSLGEMALQIDALTALITARTGIQPQTFSHGSEVSTTEVAASSVADAKVKSAPDQTSLGQRVRVALFWAALALFNLGCAVAAVFFAPLANSLLDDVAAVAPGMCGVLCLVLIIIALRRPRPQAAVPLGVLTSTPPTGDGVSALDEASWPSEATYTLTIGLGPLMRLLFLFFGLALMSAWVPLTAYVVQMLPQWATALNLPGAAPYTPGVDPFADPFHLLFSWFFLFLLMMYGVGGVTFAAVALRFKGSVWRADRYGLSREVGNIPISLAWSAVGSVAARQRQGRVASYLVRDAQGTIKLAWPATSGRRARVLMPKANADANATAPRPVTPDQMAALVAQRTHKTIALERDPHER